MTTCPMCDAGIPVNKMVMLNAVVDGRVTTVSMEATKHAKFQAALAASIAEANADGRWSRIKAHQRRFRVHKSLLQAACRGKINERVQRKLR